MAEFIAFDPKVEILGRALFPLLEGTQGRIKSFFAKNGISEFNGDTWYSQQLVLDALREFPSTMDLVSIGVSIIDHARFPPGIDSIQTGVEALNTAYGMNHRGGAIGFYRVDSVDYRRIVVTAHTPYSSDFDYGLIYGLAKRFRPPDARLWVQLIPGTPTRKLGADSCTYEITW